MSSSLASNNAFGLYSPSWNLPFPSGNLTAAEILAYLPHWLKSIDVIDRFVTNGGKSCTIATLINEFRHLPGGTTWTANSAQIMMSYAMRRAGYSQWRVGTHKTFKRPNPNLLETDLNVQSFRTPRETHPKTAASGTQPQTIKQNEAVRPIDFKALATHVKKHPSGDDSLDLSRCVQYALIHPNEKWYFPSDFGALVNKLGGPTAITRSHLDRQVFNRRDNNVSSSLSSSTPKTKKRTRSIKKSISNSAQMPKPRKFASGASAGASGSPLKRMMCADDGAGISGRRKSGRLANKVKIDFRDPDSEIEDKDDMESRSGYSMPTKKRKLSHIPLTPGSPTNDSDFEEDDTELDDDVPDAEDVTEDELMLLSKVDGGRAAARKARQVIHNIVTETQRNIEVLAKQKSDESTTTHKSKLLPLPAVKPPVNVSSEMTALARDFSSRKAVYLKPPILSADRLRVDSSSIYLYAADGCSTMEEMWESALSSVRFGGPRRHPPFRELHRLTDPLPHDESDWAENIRWAKEQHAKFGSKTWTEYDYHLELITEHRREIMWVSEEAIAAGM